MPKNKKNLLILLIAIIAVSFIVYKIHYHFSLRGQLESVWHNYIEACEEKDLEGVKKYLSSNRLQSEINASAIMGRKFDEHSLQRMYKIFKPQPDFDISNMDFLDIQEYGDTAGLTYYWYIPGKKTDKYKKQDSSVHVFLKFHRENNEWKFHTMGGSYKSPPSKEPVNFTKLSPSYAINGIIKPPPAPEPIAKYPASLVVDAQDGYKIKIKLNGKKMDTVNGTLSSYPVSEYMKEKNNTLELSITAPKKPFFTPKVKLLKPVGINDKKEIFKYDPKNKKSIKKVFKFDY